MKISVRNTFKGIIKTISVGAVNTEVTIEIAPGIAIVAIITKSSTEQLDLAEGKDTYAVIKASDVMVAVD
jgi:molybdopterin-binding protein